MIKSDFIYVSFEKNNDHYTGCISLSVMLDNQFDQIAKLKKAENTYSAFINKTRKLLLKMTQIRAKKGFISTLMIWKIGDLIFKLSESLEKQGMKIDRIYEHLSRDLNRDKSWFKKAVTLRRYIHSRTSIPPQLKWSNFKNCTKRKAIQLNQSIK